MIKNRLSLFWKNYKFRFVPWIILNLRKRKFPGHEEVAGEEMQTPILKRDEAMTNGNVKSSPSHLNAAVSSQNNPMIVHHVRKGDDKLVSDAEVVSVMIQLFSQFMEAEKQYKNAEDGCRKNLEIMHNVLGYSTVRRKSLVSDDAGTGVFLASGVAKPGSIIAMYPGTMYMPSEPIFFPSIGNPFIFRCCDGMHIDGNDKWISKSIFKSCSARDKFRIDLPCCDESWLTASPQNPLNIGQYVNNRSRAAVNNVVYQESEITIGLSLENSSSELPVQLCKYLPNVWANPGNNHYPIRLVPLIASKEIQEGEEILSSYFTLVHPEEGSSRSQ